MDALVATAARLRRFGAAMNAAVPRVDVALPALRALLRAAGVPYRLVGGLAVIHHGYQRLTVDIDVLVPRDCAAALDAQLAGHGFSRRSERRLEHSDTGVRIDLLRAGDRLPGRGTAPPLPAPDELAASSGDADVVALPALLDLKLDAGRRRDIADVVQLLKLLDDAAYLPVEGAVRADHRAELAQLRDEALEELRWERESGA